MRRNAGRITQLKMYYLCLTLKVKEKDFIMKDSTVTARINSHLKREAEDILKKIGLNSSTAISLFYSTVVINRGLPFRLRLDSVPSMDIKEQKETEKILKKRTITDKNIVKSEILEISL